MKRVLIVAVASALALAAGPAFSEWVYEGKWGSFGQGNGQFYGLYGIAVNPHTGYVYACDSYNHRIQYFTSTGSYLGQWGTEGTGRGQFDTVRGVEVDPDSGWVYAVDAYNLRVQYFSARGDFLGEWDVPTRNDNLADVAVNTVDDRVYVVHRGWGDITYYDLGGSMVGSWGRMGHGDGEFWGPNGAAVAPGGDVYIVDLGNFRMQYFTKNGSFLGKWGSRGSGPGQFDSPCGADVARYGTVFVTDARNDRLQYFTATGSFLGIIGERGQGNGQLWWPADVALDAGGNRLYVSENGNNRIQYFKRDNPTVAPSSLGRVKALFQ
jgi:tripartite motif-containing protein 71